MLAFISLLAMSAAVATKFIHLDQFKHKTPSMPPRSTTREQQRVLFAHHTAHDGKSLREFSQ